MTSNKSAIAFAIAVIFITLLGWYFYRSRCVTSPPISVLGLAAGTAMALAGAILLPHINRARAFPRPLRGLTALPFLLILLGTGATHEAMLRSDAAAMHGSSSSGDSCP